MRCQVNCYKVWDDQAVKEGIAVGDASQVGRFYWQSDISGPLPTQPGITRPPLND
jgi:hypothetical protein